MYRLGIDTGGTNTDVVLTNVDTGRMYYAKTPTTPKALMDGIMNGIKKIVNISGLQNDEIDELVYGTTIVVNMIAQKESEASALITTRGFKEVLEIGRAYRRENIYDIQMEVPEPLVKRNLRFEISGRMNFQGKETEPLNLDEIPAIVEELRAKKIKSVGICLMHSYANPEHEQIVKEALKKAWPEGFVSASSDINPQFREYERTSTTVINAYMMPNMASHIVDFEQHMKDGNIGADLYMMQSNAGVMTFDVAKSKPVAVADGGGGALVLAELGVDVGGGGHIALRPQALQLFLHLLLVGRVGVGVHQADAHGLDALGTQLLHDGGDLVQLQRLGLLALKVDAAGDLKAQIALHQRLGSLHLNVIDIILAVGTGDLQNVLEALGGDEGGSLILLLSDHVHHDGGAVHQLINLVVADAADLHDLLNAVHDAVQQRLGRGGRLGIIHPAGVNIGENNVGVGAAGVDTQSVHMMYPPFILWQSRLPNRQSFVFWLWY